MRIAYHVMSSPVGLLFVARTERGLRYLSFMERKSLKRMIGLHEADEPDAVWEPSLLGLKSYVDQIEQYFCGDRKRFTLPLDAVGSPFQLQVWNALTEIPYGETRSYIDIARAVGQPRGSRAVGLANNQNPLAIVVPCHRVIGAQGDLVGYGGGLQRKKWLLDHEARFSKPIGRTGDLFVSEHAGGPLIAAKPPKDRAASAPRSEPRRAETPASKPDARRGASPPTRPAVRRGISPLARPRTAPVARAAVVSPQPAAAAKSTPRATPRRSAAARSSAAPRRRRG
jgi:methylated-DNA-[protein]-cysteine S-methyltransferase